MCDTPMLENDGIGREGTASDYTGHECGDRRWVQSSRANLVLYRCETFIDRNFYKEDGNLMK